MSGQYTRDIPLFGRSYFGLVFLSGGVTESAGSGSRDSYPSGTNFVSNGQRNATAEVRFDGSPISAPEQGEGGNSNVYYTPSVEVIQEFKVENNSFSAEYGNNGGTVVNIMMRQGGNRFPRLPAGISASAIHSMRTISSAMLPGSPNLRSFTISTAVWSAARSRRNKTFFLFDFEKLRDIGSNQVVATVPTALQRAGDFSQTQTFDNDGNLAPVTIYNPRAVAADGTRQPFPNNKIPDEHDRSGRQEIPGLHSRNPTSLARPAQTTTTSGGTFNPVLPNISSMPRSTTNSMRTTGEHPI